METIQENADRKLVVIMFMDIVNYSKMMGDDESETLKLLNDFESLVFPLLENFGGKIVKELGDGLFCEFNSALRASECALQIQNELNTYNKSSNNKFEILVRIGIHLGDVIKKGKDLIGDGVNVAARIEPLSVAGGICISESVYQTIRNQPDFELESLGEVKLKNINHSHKIFRLITGFEKYEENNKSLANSKKGIKEQKGFFRTKKHLYKIIIPGIFISLLIIYFGFKLFDNEQSSTANSDSISMSNNANTVNQKKIFLDKLPHKSQEFINRILTMNNNESLFSFLEKNAKNGILIFGKQDEFFNLDNKFLIIIDEEKIYSVLMYDNSWYIDFKKNEKYLDLSKYYKNKRTIWIELL